METVFFRKTKDFRSSNFKDVKDVSLHTPFGTISKIFLFYGLDIKISKHSFKKNVILWISRVFSLLIWTLIIAVKICSFRYDENIKIILSAVIRRFYELSGIILWCAIYYSRKEISSLTKEIKLLVKYSGTSPSKMVFYILIAWLIVVEIALNYSRFNNLVKQCFVSSLNSIIPYAYKLNLSDSTAIFYIINGICTALGYTFPCCFVMLYVLLCNYMEEILLQYGRKQLIVMTHDINYDVLEKNIAYYNLIIATLHSLEKVMSFPVFIVFSCNSLGVFSWLAWSLIHGMSTVKVSITISYSFIIFCLISIAASKVREADTFARYTISQLLQKTPVSENDSELDIKIRYLGIHIHPPFTLTAWGYFHFTRGFLFVALGNLLTYALLIINMGEK